MAWHKPETAEIREALRQYAPQLADEPIEFLSEGWEFWAFTAGDHVLRLPMRDRGSAWKLGDRSSRESLAVERALAPTRGLMLFVLQEQRRCPFPLGTSSGYGAEGSTPCGVAVLLRDDGG